jgi:lysophospholipase L1-like esterase
MQLAPILRNAALLFAALVLTVGLAEAGTRLVAPEPTAEPSWFVPGPRGILLNQPSVTVRHRIAGRSTVTYGFNSMHQRIADEPDPAAMRVLVLGDSFTFGYGLALPDSFVGRLQQRLDARHGARAVQLLNAGTGGWGTADQLVYLEAFGDRLRPAAVVVFVDGDDLRRSRARGLFTVSEDGATLTSHDLSVPQSRLAALRDHPIYRFVLDHSHLARLVRHGIIRLAAGGPTAGPTDDRRRAEEALGRLLFARLAAWCATRDVQLTILTTGWPWLDYPWLADTMRQQGIFFRDLADGVAAVIGDDNEAFEIAGDWHPNERGAALIADAAWPVLAARLGLLLKSP